MTQQPVLEPKPSVLFVCVKNGGKSQMAAGLMRRVAGDAVEVHSAGTRPGSAVNQLSARIVAEVGADMSDQTPRPIDRDLLARVDRVVVLGDEARVEPVDGMRAVIETWETDEPSVRGIEGEERMRLVRDDIAERVRRLAAELGVTTADPGAADPGAASGVPITGAATAGTDARDPESPARYAKIVADLTHRFDGVFAETEVADAVRFAREALGGSNRVTMFQPVFVERFAREQLIAHAQATGRQAKPRPELLFVCVQNAGRSQIAAALAKHLSGGRVNVRSAGSAPSGEVNPAALEVLAERGVPAPDAYPKPLTDDVLLAADVIVTMGCGDTCPYHPGKRYEDWPVADPDGADLRTVRAICDDIQIRVTRLLGDLLNDA